jgi:hypothetical protein
MQGGASETLGEVVAREGVSPPALGDIGLRVVELTWSVRGLLRLSASSTLLVFARI